MIRTTQEQIVNNIIDGILNEQFDKDLLSKLQNEIEKSLSGNYILTNYRKFIKLYNEAKYLEDYLITNENKLNFDIWQYFWNKLFESGGYRDQIFKIYPFKYCDVDSSYEYEASCFMSGWEDACTELKDIISCEEVKDML